MSLDLFRVHYTRHGVSQHSHAERCRHWRRNTIFVRNKLERRNPTVMTMGWDSLAVMILFAGGLVLLYAVE